MPLVDTAHKRVNTPVVVGYLANSSDYNNTPFYLAESDWTQPAIAGDSNYTNIDQAPAASFWVGTVNVLGYMLQAGADSIATRTAKYEFWVEDYPNGTVWQGTPAIAPGDQVFVQSDYKGGGQASFFLEDLTSGAYTTVPLAAPYDGDQLAEFINERLHDLYLPAFGSVDMDVNVFGSNSTWYTLSYAENNRLVMTSNCESTGTVLSEPGAVNADGDNEGDFTQKWYASSPYKNGC